MISLSLRCEKCGKEFANYPVRHGNCFEIVESLKQEFDEGGRFPKFCITCSTLVSKDQWLKDDISYNGQDFQLCMASMFEMSHVCRMSNCSDSGICSFYSEDEIGDTEFAICTAKGDDDE